MTPFRKTKEKRQGKTKGSFLHYNWISLTAIITILAYTYSWNLSWSCVV